VIGLIGVFAHSPALAATFDRRIEMRDGALTPT
jgi:hypothetical protein